MREQMERQMVLRRVLQRDGVYFAEYSPWMPMGIASADDDGVPHVAVFMRAGTTPDEFNAALQRMTLDYSAQGMPDDASGL